MKGSFKPLLKRIKMRDAREGMLFMHTLNGMCRVRGVYDITTIEGDNSYVVHYETVKNAHRGAYSAEHIWIAIGWTSAGVAFRSDERLMNEMDMTLESNLASMLRRCQQYKENTSRGVLW